MTATEAVHSPAEQASGDGRHRPLFPYAETDYQEDNRGQFHFSSRGGWMNDPNGLVHHHGVYHLYYQHNPYGLAWDTMHWGHATSTDLVHWRQQPIALDPRVHPGDLFSGGGVVDVDNTSGLKDGPLEPIVVFSGTQGVRMFYSLDGGHTFSSYADGRIVARPSGGESRDPKVFWHRPSGRWVMVVWSDADGNGVDFFVSANLRTWKRTGRYTADWLFECPDLTPMPLDDDPGTIAYVLRDARGSYVVGDFDGSRFSTDWTRPCTITRNAGGAGSDYYAAQSFQNMPDGRVVTLAWQGGNHGTAWTGNASFPVQQRLVTTPGGPRVLSEPVDELRSLRSSSTTWGPASLSPDTAGELLQGRSAVLCEIEAVFDVAASSASSFALRLRTGHEGRSARDVVYDLGSGRLDGYDLAPEPDGSVRLRVLVDRGQLAVFAGNGAFYECLNVDFDTIAGGDGLRLETDGALMLESLTLHELRSAWADTGDDGGDPAAEDR